MTSSASNRPIALIVLGLTIALSTSTTGVAEAAEPSTNVNSKRDSALPFDDKPVLGHAELIRAVLKRNPSIAAARAALEQAQTQEEQRASWPDPNLGHRVSPLSVVSDDTNTGAIVELSQKVPFPGRLELRGAIARAEEAVAQQRLDLARQDLALAASLLYHDYYVVIRALEINELHVELLENAKESALVQYETGRVGQQAPIQAEVELAHMVHQETVLASQRDVIKARLNGLLHRRPTAPLPVPVDELPDSSDVAPLIPTMKARELDRSEIEAARRKIDAAEAGLQLARMNVYPDIMLTAGYNRMWMREEHRWNLGIGFELPIHLDRRRAERREADARVREKEAQLDALVDEIAVDVATVKRRLQEAQHVVGLYENRVLPSARDFVRSSQSAFEAGRESFSTWITAEKNLRTTEREYHEAVAALHKQTARLERALGLIPGLQDEEGTE